MVSDNIANSDTAGYKTTSALFEQMVTASNSARSYTSGGVAVLSRANITQQGLLAPSSNPADVAIQGAGFFVVDSAATGGTTFFTRNGSFTPDNQGMLQNDGFYLQGWRTNPDGTIPGGEGPSKLTTVNTQIAPVSASATTSVSIAANLPADAATAPTALGTSSMTVYDSPGTPSTVQISWTKTGTNTWTATFGNPTSPSDPTVQTGTTTSGSVTLNFDPSTGALTSTTPSPPTLSIGSWSDGAADSTGTKAIALDFGGMTQFASGSSDAPTISNPTINPNGFAKGDLSGFSIGKNGVVNATYSNGQTIAIYKLAVATFADPNGLAAHSDGMYSSTVSSGNATLQTSGSNGAGTIYGSELELSTTDTSGQFSNMISAQQAYSAASQVITTVNKMFDTLISSMR